MLIKNKIKIYYILINIFSAVLGFSKSYIFMKYLNFDDLGALTLIQTISLVFASLHFGYLNGCFRVFSSKELKINNVFGCFYFSYIIMIVSLFPFLLALNNDELWIGYILGFLLLINTFYKNFLISNYNLKLLNYASIFSVIVNILFLICMVFYGQLDFKLASISLIIQPIIFIFIAILFDKELHFFSIKFDKFTFFTIMKLGYGAFFASCIVLLYCQFERWGIVYYLGKNELGAYSIIFLLTAVWQIVPESIMNLYFPKYVLLLKEQNFNSLFENLKMHLIISLFYSLIASVLVCFLSDFIINLVLPKFSSYIYLARIACLALLIKSMTIPFSSLIQALAKNREMIFYQSFSVFIYALIVFISSFFINMSLSFFVIISIIYYSIIFISFVFVVIRYKNTIHENN